jgi:DNA polymerase-3 subunit alpha
MALIIDVETTGLPERGNLLFGQLPPYDDLLSYKDARVVQVSMMLCNEEFEEIEFIDFVVKADGFTISNSSFHGITNEISETKGTLFLNIAEAFSKYLKHVSHIVAHNANFDISIIKSELYRLGLYSIIDEINTKCILCTMKQTKMIVKAQYRNGGIKYPSLAELYSYVFNKNIENAHNSKYDVINLHSIVKNMYDTKQLNFNDNMLLVYEPK